MLYKTERVIDILIRCDSLCMVYRAKHLKIGELISTQIRHVKRTLCLLLLYCILSQFTQAAYPLERDIDEFTRISPPKRWIPFMERLPRLCLNYVKTKKSITFTDALKCMTIRDTSQCLATRIINGCILTRIHPNILKYQYILPLHDGLPIQIIVHIQFSLNVTVKQIGAAYSKDIGSSFKIMGRRYTEPNFSTLIFPNNSLKILFYGQSSIEYSVAQYLNATNYHQIKANALRFSRGFFLVTCFQIQVDIRARLSLDKITCLLCKIIVYDGPNEKLPIIVKIDDAGRFQRVVASTFQVFIVIIENVPQKDVLVTYSPIYKTKTVFNLTPYEYIEIRFDNSTWCNGLSWYARSCAYTFQTATRKQIRFSLINSQFTETYQPPKCQARIIIFNHFHGTTENILELDYNFARKKSFFEMVGTGYVMNIVILVYSILSSLTFTFSMSLSDCDVLLVSGNYISYSGYVTPMDDTLRVFKMNESLQTLQEYDKCLRLQFIMPLSTYKMIFPQNTPVLIDQQTGGLGSCYRCPISFDGPPHAFYDFGDRMFIRIVDSIKIKPSRLRYAQIVINWLPCTIPCQYIFDERHCNLGYGSNLTVHDENGNSTCNICENVYTGCKLTPTVIPLETTISYIPRIKSNVCSLARLQIIDYTSTVYLLYTSLLLNTSMFRMPVVRGATRVLLISRVCNIEIPLVGALSFSVKNPELMASAHDRTDVYWGGVLYRRLSRFLPVSWETAALSCQKIEASLLTIHSSAEYQFIKDTFLQALGTSILYVGVKRKVMCI